MKQFLKSNLISAFCLACFVMAKRYLQRVVVFILAAALVSLPTGAAGALLDLASTPLFLSASVPPNIFFLTDDSGSMDWNMMTQENDGIMTLTGADQSTDYNYVFPAADNQFASNVTNGRILPTEEDVIATGNMPANAHGVWRGRYSGYNGVYYNPEVTFRPWEGVDSAGVAFADTSPTAARLNPYSAAVGTVDLTASTMTWTSDNVPRATTGVQDITVTNYYPAMYYTWTDTNANGIVDADDAHPKVEIKASVPTYVHTSGKRTDCAVPLACTYTEEIGNFANWFSYYRRRVLTAKNAVGKVVGPSVARMGHGTLHNNGGASNIRMALMNIASNTGAKKTLLDGVYKMDAANGTPLRNQLSATGKYYECVSGNIFGDAAGTNCPILPLATGGNCQQNFTVMMTDGFYNDSFTGLGNVDADGNTPNAAGNTTFDGGAYADTFSNTLGDIAMHYYERDLSSLANNVPVTAGVDNAGHQHMVTYTVAFGLKGILTGDPPNSTSPFAWPDPTLGDAQKIDDVRHAAYNGRGKFLSANNPDTLITALSDAIASITDRTGSAAAVAVNSRSLTTDTRVYQARFTSGEWSGDLRAIPIQTNGTVGTVVWSAQDQLKTQNWDTGRQIITWNGTAGVPFRWGSLSLTEQGFLNTNPATSATDTQGSARLNYLRGDVLNEGTNNNYRVRNNGFKLGDIVDSSPIYIGPPQFMPDMEAVAHAGFRTANFNRTPMIYVGANDGMLHAVDASTGMEKFAYVPASLYPVLNKLTDNNYVHRYFVNGSPTVADAFYNGAWHTLLVSGLSGGGKGYFALDVTNPANFTEGNAASIAQWEFSSSNDADLGYTFSQPVITKMKNGKWAAVFGNGYNNTGTTGRAQLFIVFLENAKNGNFVAGTDYIKIDTKVGSTATPNGLASPAVVDVDSDFVADYVYAGDIQGNMWKFDVTSSNPSAWGSAYGTGATPRPLFAAVDGGGNPQPITSRPQVTQHPDGQTGYMVYFGTGKYIENGDKTASATPVNTFYGIWDKAANSTATPVVRANLLPQLITPVSVAIDTNNDGVNDSTVGVRTITNDPINWAIHLGWREDLPTLGEKSVSDAVVISGSLPRVLYTTLIPDSSACSAGGNSWLMEVSPKNGGQNTEAVFDLNGDGVFDTNDAPTTVGVHTDGILPEPVVLYGPTITKIDSISTGEITTIKNYGGDQPGGRRSWRQLK